jgi:hypothetical protein
LFLVKKRESADENQVKLVAYTIMLYISSLFVPFVVIAGYQSMAFTSKSQWFFTTPLSAYLVFMAGMIFIAAVFTVFLIFRQKWKGRVFRWIIICFVLLSIPSFILSMTNYYYFDDKGIHYNFITGLQEKEYQWENVDTLHKVYRNHRGSTGYYQFKFEMKDGKMVTIPFNDKLSENQYRIEEKMQKHNIETKDNFDHPIVD